MMHSTLPSDFRGIHKWRSSSGAQGKISCAIVTVTPDDKTSGCGCDFSCAIVTVTPEDNTRGDHAEMNRRCNVQLCFKIPYRLRCLQTGFFPRQIFDWRELTAQNILLGTKVSDQSRLDCPL